MSKLISLLLALILVCLPVRAARSFNGTSDAGTTSTLSLSGQSAITVVFWLHWTTFANDDKLALEYSANYGTNAGSFIIDANDSGGKFLAGMAAAGTYNTSEFTRPTAGAWHHYAIVFDRSAAAANQIIPYLDGAAASYTKFSSSAMSGNFSNYNLYLMSRAATGLFGGGRMAELAVYGGALSANDIAALGKGYSPLLIARSSLLHYFPLGGRMSPEIGLLQGASVTLTGTSYADGPALLAAN